MFLKSGRQLLRRALNLPGRESNGPRKPSLGQWKQIGHTLTLRERLLASAGILLIAFAGVLILGRIYFNNTAVVPAKGGNITIGVVGRPLYLNPVLAPSNPADASLTRMIFAGLFRYNKEGKLTVDLADSFSVGDFGKVIDVKLKNNIKWPDGEPLTADDVTFTINAIKNPSIRSPLFDSFNGVVVEALDVHTVRFILPTPYPPFIHNLTLGIIPKHLWEDIAPESFALSEQNLKPTGLGPFRPTRFERTREGRILSYTLEPNDLSKRPPFLDQIVIRFFEQRTDAFAAFNRREINLLLPINDIDRESLRGGAKLVSFDLPRTFGLFFNQTTSKAAADRTVRVALAYATERGTITETLGGDVFAKELQRPIPAGMLGATLETVSYDFAPEHARNLLEAAGWTIGEDGIRKKNGEALTFAISFREGADMQKIAEILREQWKAVGASLQFRVLTPATYRKAVMDRDYQILIAGEELPPDPDPYAFWHSSQKFNPGGNIALYENKSVDQILEASRNEFDEAARAQKYFEFQKILMDEVPAIFLWQRRYVAAVGPTVQGLTVNFIPEPSWLFRNIDEWYIQTKRVWK